jgi:hypothetical protein
MPQSQPPGAPPPDAPPKAVKQKGGVPRWIWWVVGGFSLLCLVAAVVAGVIFLPDLIGGGEVPFGTSPTETPTPTPPPPTATASPEPAETPIPAPTEVTSPTVPPAFDAVVLIEVSSTQVALGERVTVTVTLSNTGEARILSPRYQLVGDWASVLTTQTPEVVSGEVVDPGASEERVFVLEASASGEASLSADVTMAVEERDDLEARRSQEIVVTVP